jgi:hypothetical protein
MKKVHAIGVLAGTSGEFGAFMKARIDRWTVVADRGGIPPQ